ncbi:hypothetical protein [Congregibacter litoralis]|uniref:Uncharacterized protein n=1 Tax=Congregibacter litoralis KT71 TaxID=314285 RepID=A4AB34_9GAMM|nr:hypothetical protein [Congregibacter litoralis]EAQ96906.1 hypothetical protein KT71_11414 [Congregibacter litoralis KT71]
MSSLDPHVPVDAQQDPWLLFHGTSNLFESRVRKEGLRARKPVFSIDQLTAVADIFEALSWSGEHPGGYAVLKPFSIGHDFSQRRGQPIFLAESALRAATFATADFAGGEVCRALSYCLADLERYVSDDVLREKHYERCERRPGMSRLPREMLPTVDFVATALAKLKPLVERVAALRAQYTCGVIYAIRISPDNLDELAYHSSMGIKCFRAIRVAELESSFQIPSDYEPPVFEEDKRLIEIAMGEDGIVNTIRQLDAQLKTSPE